MKKGKRKYSYTYDDYTVFFDVGDVVVTKFGNMDIILDVKESDNPLLPTVHFANIESLCASRISYRTDIESLVSYLETKAKTKGFVVNSTVKFIQVNDIIIGCITNLYYKEDEYRMYIEVYSEDHKNYVVPLSEAEVIDHYKTTEDKVRDIISEHCSFYNIRNANGLIAKLVDMIEDRPTKINRIIDNLE
jgi:hypothetical protein